MVSEKTMDRKIALIIFSYYPRFHLLEIQKKFSLHRIIANNFFVRIQGNSSSKISGRKPNFFKSILNGSSARLTLSKSAIVGVKVLTTTPSESSHVVCVFVHDIVRFFGFTDSPVFPGPVNRVSPIVLIVCYSALVFSWRQSVYSSTPVFEQTVIDQNLRTTFNFLQKIKKLLIFRVRYFKPIWEFNSSSMKILLQAKSRVSRRHLLNWSISC